MLDASPDSADDTTPDPMSWLQRHAQPAPEGHWDELRNRLISVGAGAGRPPGPLWQQFVDRLGAQGLQGLTARMEQLQQQVRDNGITYNVYADSQQPERPWALDLFPLMVSHEQWPQIERGVLQRMHLLEHIMRDAYGEQQLVGRGLLPMALVQGHPGYLPAMQGVKAIGGHCLSLAAFDLARGPDGLWWLLSQRTQAPSGLGYLLENRLIVSRLFPEAFESLPVQRLAASYRALVDSIKARCPRDEGEIPHVALLTPGPYNETYFEHAYLARYLGLTLVQADDLTVRGQRLYLKTLQGLQRVHGLLKRVDDEWLDPLQLRADSSLGVPGLLQAVRSGQLLVANPPGTAFLESNALLGFMPALAKELLDEELMLPAIPSWWCGEAAALPAALEQMAHGVVKPTYPSGGQSHSFEPVAGHGMDQRERDEWTGRILREPQAYTVQSWLPLSHMPVWNARAAPPGGMETRPVILRVFAIREADGQVRVLPGGLARLGTHEGIASMQRGGSSADVWVQAPSREAVDQLSLLGQREAPLQRQRVVTSRAAENLFWMGRYTERTENTLRLARLGLDVLSTPSRGGDRLLQWIERMALRHGLVREGVPSATQSHRVFSRSLMAALWDTGHATSVGFNLKSLLGSAAAVRERLSPEHWQMLQQAESLFFAAAGPLADHGPVRLPDTADTMRCLQETSQRLAALTGAQTDRMIRDDGWRLLSIGRHIERLEFLAGAFSFALHARLLDEQTGFDAVLQLFDSSISFHAQYQQSRTPQALVELLVTRIDNPRALAWVAQTLRARLLRMGTLADGNTRSLAALIPEPEDDLWPQDMLQGPLAEAPTRLLELLTRYQQVARQVSDGLSSLFFTHSTRNTYSVGG